MKGHQHDLGMSHSPRGDSGGGEPGLEKRPASRNDPRRRRLLGAAVVVVVLLGILFVGSTYAWWQWTHVVVAIRLDASASATVTNLELSVAGDRAVAERVDRGAERIMVLKPAHESGLQLRYTFGDANCRWAGGYVEPAGGYRVVLDIRSCDVVRDNTSLWP